MRIAKSSEAVSIQQPALHAEDVHLVLGANKGGKQKKAHNLLVVSLCFISCFGYLTIAFICRQRSQTSWLT